MGKLIAMFCGALFAAGMMFAGAPVELENLGFHQADGKGGAVGWTRGGVVFSREGGIILALLALI